MATIESERPRTESAVSRRVSSPTQDETKLSFKTTEFWAMGGVIAAILLLLFPIRSATSARGRWSPSWLRRTSSAADLPRLAAATRAATTRSTTARRTTVKLCSGRTRSEHSTATPRRRRVAA